MPMFTGSNGFAFDTSTFNFQDLTLRAFDAFDRGATSNYRTYNTSTPRSSQVNEEYDRTYTAPDGTMTIVSVFQYRGGSLAGPIGGAYITKISEYRNSELQYTLLDNVQFGSNNYEFNARQVFVSTGGQSDYVVGSIYSDNLNLGSGINYAAGLDGDDFLIGGADADRLDGGEGSDRLLGAGGSDYLDGGNGYDELIGGAGRDVLNGGQGIDTATYLSSVFVHLGAPDLNTGEAEGDVFISIEALTGSGQDDVLVGDNGDNQINGFGGRDVIYGLGGNDGLSASGAGSQVFGGDGDDWLYAAASALLDGGAGDDRLQGGSDLGGNILRGGSGSDNLLVFHGSNTLDGGEGADILAGGDGFDWASYENAAEGVRVNFSDISQNKGEAAGDTYRQMDGVIGSRFADVLIGSVTTVDGVLPYVMAGGGGDDVLVSIGPRDTLYGGSGNDIFFIASTATVVIEGLGDGFDRIYADESYILPDHVEGLYLQGSAVTGIGNAGDNGIGGNALNNVLSGGAGNDVLFGFGGKDNFVFRAGYGHDVIADFEGAGATDADVVQIDPALAASFAGLMALGRQTGSDTIFTFDTATSLIMSGVTLSSLQASDFVFA